MHDLRHSALNATFTGIDQGPCRQYRGIRYGTIPSRFAEPVLLTDWNGAKVDCRNWGPRCPQNKFDVGYLLRAPQGDVFYDDAEDEFECLNLDITVPDRGSAASGLLPVMVWIHGGSQIISFGNGASKVGDTRKLVADSVVHGKPMIVVSVQYRLNIFHVGDGQGTKNLGFRDQKVAVQWVREYIAGFGGDADNITLAGESAGAVFVHGLIVSGVQVRRAVLMSGSLYMSPPRPEGDAKAFPIEPVSQRVRAKGYSSLKDAPCDVLLQAQADISVPSVFLQEEDCFSDWQTKSGNVEELMIGECEFESILWRSGIESMSAKQIMDCFDMAGRCGTELKNLYHIHEGRATQCKIGALDFLQDLVWVLPTLMISNTFREARRKTYRYLFDQANPWQASSRAHHAVDLIYLFGGFDLSGNASAEAVSSEMRRRFIMFVNGEEAPWKQENVYAFGPLGQSGEIDEAGVVARRRVAHVRRLQEMNRAEIYAAFRSLAAGRLSLHN